MDEDTSFHLKQNFLIMWLVKSFIEALTVEKSKSVEFWALG